MARDGEPTLMPTVVADKTAALQASNGLMAAVIRRMASGKGVLVETSMFEGLVGYTLLEHQHGTIFDPPLSGPGYPRTLSRDRRAHRTADGYICMLAYSDKQWERFWQLSDRPELINDQRFVNLKKRAENIDALYQLVGKIFAPRTTKAWLETLQGAEIPAGPVNRLEDLRGDEHLNATDFFRHFTHPTEGNLEIPGTPYRLDGAPLPIHRHQPCLGEHTHEVLRDAGLSNAEIEAVREN